MDREYLTTDEAAARLKVSPSYLAKLRCSRSDGPRFTKFGRSVRYRVSDLDAWAETLARHSTSDRGSCHA
jgi:excisionase family DNA binding protein